MAPIISLDPSWHLEPVKIYEIITYSSKVEKITLCSQMYEKLGGQMPKKLKDSTSVIKKLGSPLVQVSGYLIVIVGINSMKQVDYISLKSAFVI